MRILYHQDKTKPYNAHFNLDEKIGVVWLTDTNGFGISVIRDTNEISTNYYTDLETPVRESEQVYFLNLKIDIVKLTKQIKNWNDILFLKAVY